MVTLLKKYLFGSGDVEIEQVRNVYMNVKVNDGEIFLHHDAIDDLIKMLNEAKTKMEDNLK